MKMSSHKYKVCLKPLFSLKNSDLPPPTLKLDSADDEANEVTLGRSDRTGISDKRCSREHMRLRVDSKCNELVVEQAGSNAGCLICDGCTSTLAKHDTKRVPVENIGEGDQICTVYLIEKDRLYGYDVILEAKETASVEATSDLKKVAKNSSGKRQSSTLDSFIVKKSKLEGAPDPPSSNQSGEWREVAPSVYMFSSESVQPSAKIAGFDMDGTLIATASGAKWPKNRDDWKFLYPAVPTKLQKLHKEGFKLIIFTNQAGIANGTLKPADIKHKIEAIISRLGLPMQAMVAGCKRGIFRKPLPGMWNEVTDSRNNPGEAVSLTDCIYVGDAAGRVANWTPGRKKDFSNSDRLFAINCGIPFATPEAFFLGHKEGDFVMPEFSPARALETSSLLNPSTGKLSADSPELIIMVGFPGSGKSFFSSRYLSAYARVNRDTLGSWQKCVARCEQELKQGKSVVIDNTNPDKETRARYLELAKKYKITARCFHMSTTYKQSRHNEVYRQLTNSKHKPINDMIVNAYKSKYAEPEKSEGFAEIVQVNIVPKFEDAKQKSLYSLYLLDK